MKILIDTGHPAELLFFAQIANKLKWHDVLFIIREKDCALPIAENLKLKFISKGRGSNVLLLKPFYFLRALWVLYMQTRKIKPDILVSFASPYAGVIARISKKPHIAFLDTEHGIFLRWLDKTFANHIITPDCFQQNLGAKQIRVNTYKELAYLSPAYFTPDRFISKNLNLPDDFILVRLVNHGAMHDVFKKQWNRKSKFQWIAQLAKKYPLIISSEIKLPTELEPYRLTAPPQIFHQVLAHAKLVVGESATVATESAVLGVPSVCIEYNSRGYIDELENRYGLIKRYHPESHELKKAEGFIHATIQRAQNTKFHEQRQQLLSEKIDIAKFMVWFIESYPESAHIMKENPDYQYRFK